MLRQATTETSPIVTSIGDDASLVQATLMRIDPTVPRLIVPGSASQLSSSNAEALSSTFRSEISSRARLRSTGPSRPQQISKNGCVNLPAKN